MMRRAIFVFAFVLGAYPHLSPIVDRALAADKTPQFNRDVRPILSDKCFACHGPDSKTIEGDLRLDLREEAIDRVGAVVPGDSQASELVRRILSVDESEQMPPPKTGKALSAQEKATLAAWIDAGAEYEPHWSYTPMRRPTNQYESLTKTIDTLISNRLASEGILANPEADRVTLIRRLCFDLTGMPPTLAEVDAFVNDSRPDAYQRLIDRLLQSPRYGERMAMVWLDLVRYADTVGYHGDQDVSQSPYRDYVIDAFNNNLPYNQFVLEQLAGDLLPNPTTSQLVASGYNRLNQTTEEGGSQAKEYLAIYFADRVRNVSQVFMGATVGCAQCHDHKYDPYSTQDFYALGAFFADLEEVGVYGARSRPPMIHVPTAEQQAEIDKLDTAISELNFKEAALRSELAAGQAAWESKALAALEQTTEVELTWVNDDISAAIPSTETLTIVNNDSSPAHEGSISRRQSGQGLFQHIVGNLTGTKALAAEDRLYAWIYLDPADPPTAVMVQFNDGTWEHRKIWGSDDIPYGRTEKSSQAYRRAGELPKLGEWVRLEITAEEVGLAQKNGTDDESKLVNSIAFTQYGGTAYWDEAGLISSDSLPKEIQAALKLAAHDRNPTESKLLQEYYLEHAAPIVALRAQVAELQSTRKSIYESATSTVVSKATEPRVIRVLPRGNWMDDSGPVVEPAVPQFLGQLDVQDRRANRVDLAKWLCSPDNPLTARTMVNRVWSLLFGRGICASVDDLGGQGSYPSYPELLDALALEFIDSGWDLKHLIRSIIMSEAYRRDSARRPDLIQEDPYNELFARQMRFTIPAESVRDTALAISGLLVEEIGGPSVKPYQPAGYYAQLNFPKREYTPDIGPNQYRRGVYTHWQRTFLHPMLKAFDAPSREECTAQRPRSNTPLQALALLNDPSFVEAARVFAQQVIEKGGQNTRDRVAWAFATTVSRQPSDQIVDLLSDLYEEHLAQYRDDPSAAEKLLSIGNSPSESTSPAELAAWCSVTRVLLNLHETITRY